MIIQGVCKGPLWMIESTSRFTSSALLLLGYSVDRSTALPKRIQRRAVRIDR